MIVDRKMALLNSNNIQDRPNMEMMIHLEGPIVDSLYDTALISWFRPMHPPLPLLDSRYRPPEEGYKFGMENEYATAWILDGSKGAELFQTLQQGAGGRHDGEVDKRGKEDPASSESLGTGVPFISGTYQTITEHLSKPSCCFTSKSLGLTLYRCRRSARYARQYTV
jgi:hypothetical protein